jgi:hypothetical protein
LLLRIRKPSLIKALSKSSDNIFREITSTYCLTLRNELLNFWNIFAER